MLLTREGRVKVIDFGLSHVYPLDANGGFDRSTPLTDMCGSKSYAAPEVQRGATTSIASDCYALGVVLRWLAAHAEDGDRWVALIAPLLDVDPARRPSVAAIARALAAH